MTEVDLGPQVKGERGFIARMRCHQSWWRAARLRVPWGVGPLASGKQLGSCLRSEDAQEGMNFLRPEIFELVKAQVGAGVERYRCLHNLLSSQPMCFNLVGLLRLDRQLAAELLSTVVDDVVEVLDVRIEWAPAPASKHLDDRTSFDAFVEYRRDDGSLAFLAIETKLTEPFSQKNPAEKDAKYLVKAGELAGVWHIDRIGPTPARSWYQLWRNHLLAEALLAVDTRLATGRLVVIGHQTDQALTDAIANYRTVLVDPDSILDLRLNRIIELWTPVVARGPYEQWLADFRDRYVDLSMSAGACHR